MLYSYGKLVLDPFFTSESFSDIVMSQLSYILLRFDFGLVLGVLLLLLLLAVMRVDVILVPGT